MYMVLGSLFEQDSDGESMSQFTEQGVANAVANLPSITERATVNRMNPQPRRNSVESRCGSGRPNHVQQRLDIYR
jgi:hypothetical protein